MTTETAALILYIKQYALDHYEDGGWDVVAECYDDEDIMWTLNGCRTKREALDAFEFVVSVYAERQADARNSAF